ncbi:MAG: MtrB/PioB family outer membrane beta-barrel protein [Thermodesulfobacteriota bacterium]
MKIRRGIRVGFLAVMLITLTCPGGFADMDVGTNYTLGGYISLGGGWLSNQPRHMDRAYLKKYLPFPQGFLAYTDLTLESKDGLEYYRYYMSQPGLRDQDFLLQAGRLRVYHAEIEYDQLQNLYCTVNPFNNNIGILVQRLRFSGYYTPTPEITIFAENDFLRRTGWQPGSYLTGPGNPYNFTTYLRPINYKQNDMRAGVEYDQQTDQNSIFQGRMSYHLSTFENGQTELLARRLPIGATAFVSLPPSNMANYVTAEGALNLKSYKTRITGSISYGWLSQNDSVIESNTSSPTATPRTFAGRYAGLAGLSATTFAAAIGGVTRPIAPLTLRYAYRAYNYDNNNTANQILRAAFGENQNLLVAEQYSYFRQGVNLGADYRVNNMLAFNLGYAWKGVSRTDAQGRTSENSPQVGIKLVPTNWLSLMANYTYTTRIGTNSLAFVRQPEEGEILIPLTYKFYTASLIRNNANFIAEVYPVNNVNCSFNFSIYRDSYTDSTFGLQSDQGWSTGVDVSWRPHDRVALSLGYDHQQLRVKQVAAPMSINGTTTLIAGDAGLDLTTSDTYDTFVASADIKLIPKKLNWTTRASYSTSNSNFNNFIMPDLNEYYADVRTYLTYQFNEHWACRGGYIFQIFGMSEAYGQLYLQGVNSTTAARGANQQQNTLDGFYRNATAHILQGFLQYKF